MSKNSGFFTELISRRIPQYIGMYIAALWLAVEIADWMSEKFSISSQFSTYVFVGMLTMLPMVVLFAWGHGRPGKDSWSRVEIVWLPINLVLAYLMAHQFVGEDQEALIKDSADQNQVELNALQTEAVPETTAMTLFEEVDKTPNHQSVISFFWSNETGDENIEWLRYGAPWLVSQDLKRTPVLSVKTPYDSWSILNEIKDRGFEDALDVPKALALQIAGNQSAKWMILGSIHTVGGNLSFTARVVDVISGTEMKSMTVTDDNALKALDSISKEISELLHQDRPESENIIADLAIAEHTSDDIKAIEHIIDAKNHVAFENDYESGMEDINKALQQDQNFAEANVLAVSYFRAMGDIPKAVEHSRKALMLDYKVYQEKVFALRANLFGMTGEQNKAMTVLENWVKVYPSSAAGLTTLGRNYMMLNELDSAKNVYEKLIHIDDNTDESLVNLGRIYRLEDNKDKAIEILRTNLENNPSKAAAYIELADAYRQFLMLDEAYELYEQSSVISSDGFEAEIGMAYIHALKGDVPRALNVLEDLFNKASTDHQRVWVLMSMQNLNIQTGQLKKALQNNELLKAHSKSVFNPLKYLFTVDGMEIEINVLLGNYDLAIEKIEKVKNETKPPYNQIASVFNLIVYEAMQDRAQYEVHLNDFEAFMEEYPMPVYEQMLLNWKGKVASWNGDHEQAMSLFSDAKEKAKKSFIRLQTMEILSEILYSKAHTLMDMNRHEESLQVLDLVLTQNPMLGKGYYLKAKNHYHLNDIAKARVELSQAREFWKYADSEFIFLEYIRELESKLDSLNQS